MKLFFVCCLLLLSGWAGAQAPDSLLSNPRPVTTLPTGAAVVLPPTDTLFRVYGRVGSFGPQERAEAIQRRLLTLLDAPLFSPDSLYVTDSERDSEIMYADTHVLSVGAAEAQALGLPQPTVARQYLSTLRSHLTAAQQASSLPELLKRGALAVLTLLMLAGLIYGLNRFFRAINQRILLWRGSPLKPWRINNYELLTQERQLAVLRTLLKVLRLVLVALTVYLALPLLFSLFPWTEGFSRQLLGYVLGPVQRVVLAVVHYVPNLLTIVVIYLFTTYAVRFLRFLAGEVATGQLVIEGFYPDWALPTFNLVRFALYVFMFIVIFPYLPGSDSPVFQGVSVLLGFVISFGSTSAIGNLVAGIVITYMRPFKVGDRVKIGEVVGDVLEKTLLVTRLRTVKNEDITIPNSNILTGHTVNYSAAAEREGLVLHSTVTIGYDVPWPQVHELLLRAARATQGVETTPAPFVLQTSLDDFYVSYQINAYTRQPHRQAALYSELHQHIQTEFARAGVEVMSPHYRATRSGSEAGSTIPQLPAQ
ncbi:mechanosensitive ion channel family protein [Hymenobacter taeanensis]|uniref:Mechanosensitive ion channel family protein n=1 Tax=Hymenobacter taeanensis TaxID=2735321 RepID=A0A6M6BCQ6_9BACT|nr:MULTISPECIES: mechanosensitive ion channel family protein [Hymenobacter]QJX46251.1 mechanosensitive ion channel family protein [Hymenobacter taeanensis]UOQ80105.1 mechanosensitive ion channel family protein [Hymenobacter sp. 5414T-23]